MITRDLFPDDPKAEAERKLREAIRNLPWDQGYTVTAHDPPRDGLYYYTLQFVGPPMMDNGKMVGCW